MRRSHVARAWMIVVLGLSLSAAVVTTAQAALRNFGDPPPDCTIAKVMQNDGDFPPPPLGPPGCRLIDSSALTITSAVAVPDSGNSYRLQIAVAVGSVTKNNQSYPITNAYVSSTINAQNCFQWGDGNPDFECVPVYRYENPDGSGGSGGNLPLCNDGTCKLLFTPNPSALRQWVRVQVVGVASGLGAAGGYHAAANAIVYVDPRGLPPTAVIRAVQSSSDPFTWTFDGRGSVAQEPGRSITGWAWDFGDGKTATGSMVEHTFDESGLFTVKLKVTDSAGAEGSTQYLADVSPLVVSLSAGVTNGKVFSVDVTVKNADTAPMTGLAFEDPQGIVADPTIGDPATAAQVAAVDGPTPGLPTSLAAGESATATVTFSVAKQGGIDLVSKVTATDSAAETQTGTGHAIVQIGRRPITTAEKQRIFSDALIDASQSVGALFNAAHARIGLLMAWATGPSGGDTVPSWLTGPIAGSVTIPPGTSFNEPPWLNVTAARGLGLDDRATSWVPDDTSDALLPFVVFADHFAFSGGKVIDDSGNAAYAGLQNAAEFYGQMASGNAAFRAEAGRQISGMVADLGDAAGNSIGLLNAIVLAAHDDPEDLPNYENSPVVEEFTQQSAAIIDAGLQATYAEVAEFARLAQTDLVAAAGKLGDTLGSGLTTMARDIALTEFGAAGVAHLGRVIEGAMPLARTGARLDGGLAAADPATAALGASLDGTGEVVVRQALETLGEGATITPAQLEALGGFYAQDAQRVQKIIDEINTKYGVKIEIQCRPGNPESLQFYLNGTGVPKPEWVKPKNVEWMDIPLGAPEGAVGKATVFRPIRPTKETLSKFTQAQQQTILARYDTQLEIFNDATKPGGKFAKLLADSQNPEGATVTIGHGTGTRDVTGLKYSLRPVGEPGQEAFLVIDDAAGGKFVLSDADYQAVIDADSMKHLPAGKRGQAELDLMYRLNRETVSFGGHGWTHSGFEMAAKYSKPFLQFTMEYSSPASARRIAEWFVGRGDLPDWLHKIYQELGLKLGRPPTNDELVENLLQLFRPGNFVIKFNGTDMRVGYGAGIR